METSAGVHQATLLERAEWSRRRREHQVRVDRLVAAHLARRRTGTRHPVEDFMFTYYSHRPAALRRWHPGPDVRLRHATEAVGGRGYVQHGSHTLLDPAYVAAQAGRVRWIRDLLVATAARSPAYGCLGLHEWAMVYRAPQDRVRHASWPLRLGAHGTDEVVEQHRISCTHYDAFRFFTAEARPLNSRRPSREGQMAQEQPGCLHAGMDLYKWAYKLAPMSPSELVADCFELARDIRVLDMRSSPYDLRELGYEPVCIETAEGKRVYTEAQRGFTERAAPLRQRLTELCDRLLAYAAAGASPTRGRQGR